MAEGWNYDIHAYFKKSTLILNFSFAFSGLQIIVKLNFTSNRVSVKVPEGNPRTRTCLASIYCPEDKFYTDSVIGAL